MKSLYIVYIANCFLWTMSDNKTYLILSYLILSYVIPAWYNIFPTNLCSMFMGLSCKAVHKNSDGTAQAHDQFFSVCQLKPLSL